MREIFETWKLKSSEFGRIQWVYALTSIILLFIGGLISLIDNGFGIQIATFSFYAAVVFALNFVVSSVITSLIGNAKTRSTKR